MARRPRMETPAQILRRRQTSEVFKQYSERIADIVQSYLKRTHRDSPVYSVADDSTVRWLVDERRTGIRVTLSLQAGDKPALRLVLLQGHVSPEDATRIERELQEQTGLPVTRGWVRASGLTSRPFKFQP
jgi:8-oxo-dGTP pyrophosphatase MutT (NUDIX family)